MDKPEFRCPTCGHKVSAESVDHLVSKVRQHLHEKHQQEMSRKEVLQMVNEAEKERQKTS
ncbi:MAG: DUF1059 domain-containing protein [Anaerolineae bacterium]